jgi:hypothetical protein
VHGCRIGAVQIDVGEAAVRPQGLQFVRAVDREALQQKRRVVPWAVELHDKQADIQRFGRHTAAMPVDPCLQGIFGNEGSGMTHGYSRTTHKLRRSRY